MHKIRASLFSPYGSFGSGPAFMAGTTTIREPARSHRFLLRHELFVVRVFHFPTCDEAVSKASKRSQIWLICAWSSVRRALTAFRYWFCWDVIVSSCLRI